MVVVMGESGEIPKRECACMRRWRWRGKRGISAAYVINHIPMRKGNDRTYFAARTFLGACLRRGMDAASARLHDEYLGIGSLGYGLCSVWGMYESYHNEFSI
ncbi:hypothetical protein ACMFMF_009977 [Clarireedia jacksonii]